MACDQNAYLSQQATEMLHIPKLLAERQLAVSQLAAGEENRHLNHSCKPATDQQFEADLVPDQD